MSPVQSVTGKGSLDEKDAKCVSLRRPQSLLIISALARHATHMYMYSYSIQTPCGHSGIVMHGCDNEQGSNFTPGFVSLSNRC